MASLKEIYELEREEFLRSKYVWIWSLLAFQAGFINSFGFLVCGRFVSHVTGFGTQIGVSFAKGDGLGALIMAATPLMFVLGSFTSSFLTLTRIEKGLHPRYDIVTGVIPISLYVFAFFGDREVVSRVGSPAEVSVHLSHLFSLTFLCGMQNGCFATMTKGQIRTTHLTGISTDLGSDLARLLFAPLPNRESSQLKRLNAVRAFTFVAFSSGAIISTLVSIEYGNHALVVPAVTATVIFFTIRKLVKNKKR